MQPSRPTTCTLRASSSPCRLALACFAALSDGQWPRRPSCRAAVEPTREERIWRNRCQILCSAPSRIAHVFSSTTSASSIEPARSKPAVLSSDLITSVSATFIWQP
eukprot:scaffold12515_cov56-Phaeocystis_antarctica.AAC.6